MEGGAVANDANNGNAEPRPEPPPPAKKFKGKRQGKKLGRRGKRGGDRKEIARAVAPDQRAGDNPPDENTAIRPSRAAIRKQTNAQFVNLISLEKRRSSRERNLKEAAIEAKEQAEKSAAKQERNFKEVAIEAKEKAEKSAAKHKKKVGELIDTVRNARQQTRSAKQLQSKAEREAKDSIAAAEGKHAKERKSLEAEHKVRQGATCYLF